MLLLASKSARVGRFSEPSQAPDVHFGEKLCQYDGFELDACVKRTKMLPHFAEILDKMCKGWILPVVF